MPHLFEICTSPPPQIHNLHIHSSTKKDEEFIEKAVNFMMTVVKRNSMVHEDSFRALLEKYPPDKPYVRSDCLDYYYEHITEFAVPFSEQINVIKRLNEMGVKNAIVTNIPTARLESQKKKIEVLGISSLFDAIVISAELGIQKPDRRIYDYTTNLLGVKNEECVFVGDDPDSDIIGAIGADMDAVWLDNYGCVSSLVNHPRVSRVKSVLEYFVF